MWHRLCYWLSNLEPWATVRELVRDLWANLKLVPWLLAIASFFVLQVGQLREVYLVAIETQNWTHFNLGLVMTSALCVLLHSINLHLAHTSGARDPDVGVIRMRFISAAICGSLPLIGVAAGIMAALNDVRKNSNTLMQQAGIAPGKPILQFTLGDRTESFIGVVHQAVPFFVVALAAVGLFIWFARITYRAQMADWKWGSSWTVGIISVVSAFVTLAAVVILPLLPPPELLVWSKNVGPFALTALQLMLACGIAWTLVWLSRLSGWPVTTILLGLVVYLNWGGVGDDDARSATSLTGTALTAAKYLVWLGLAAAMGVLATRLIDAFREMKWSETHVAKLDFASLALCFGVVLFTAWSTAAHWGALPAPAGMLRAAPVVLPVAGLGLLAWWGSRSGWVGVPILAVAGTCFGTLYYTFATDANREFHQAPQSIAVSPAHGRAVGEAPSFNEMFQYWLHARRDVCRWTEVNPGKPFPVLLVAVQGGGIYASSSASTFLAEELNYNPRFNEHLFAISGVSGGAVGAALYHAAIASASGAETQCPALVWTPNSLVRDRLHHVITDDHLSPVLAVAGADYLHKFVRFSAAALFEWWWTGAPKRLRRETALEASLACSLTLSEIKITPSPNAGRQTSPDACDPNDRSHALKKPFNTHFPPTSGRPALVLNTTSAESGRRVAFAPFKLANIGEGSLMSFGDEFFAPQFLQDVSVVQAAGASARFPGLMPAFTIEDKYGPGKRWNFVDGGYADNSGVATAAAMFAALKALEGRLNIKVGMIVLTDESRRPDYDKLYGTGLTDTRAQIETLLNVRSGIGSRETYLAQERFKATAPAKAAAGIAQDATSQTASSNTSDDQQRVFIVKIDQTNYALQLGWMISTLTNSLMGTIAGLDSASGGTLNGVLKDNRESIRKARAFLKP